MFVAVARVGTLAGAAAELGASVPTVSRHMSALEEACGRALFQRGDAGYALTAEGRALAEAAADLEVSLATVERWRLSGAAARSVRISAGDWTMLMLSRHLHEVGSDAWTPVLEGSNARLDIARRQIDIGVRNRRPTEPWLAARRIGSVMYAIYGEADAPFVGATETALRTPAIEWLERSGLPIGVRVSTPRIGLDLALAGAARIVVPLFIGDESGLERAGDVIEELTSEQWLVFHQDERNVPVLRSAIEAVGMLLERYT